MKKDKKYSYDYNVVTFRISKKSLKMLQVVRKSRYQSASALVASIVEPEIERMYKEILKEEAE